MGLKLPWRATGSGESVATVGGYTLTAFVSGDGGSWEVEYAAADVLPLPTTLTAAQEAAEAAAARLLAEDAGVRALMGLRWIPVGERLPDEGQAVEAVGIMRFLGSYAQGVFRDDDGRFRRDVTHWRPLGAGPEVGQ